MICFAFLLGGELCSRLSFRWSLRYSHTGYAEIPQKAGNGGFEHAKHTALWEYINHVTAFKFLSLPHKRSSWWSREEVFTASKSKSNAHFGLYFMVSYSFPFFSLPFPPPKRRLVGELSPASAEQIVGILVETGNSVDYSLAIRLLSLQWLSLLHHEIAWLSARLESVLCSNPPAPLHPLTRHPFTPPSHNSLSPPRKKSSSGSPQVSEAVQQQDRLTSCAILITSFPLTTVLPPFLSLAQEHVLWCLHIVNGPYDLIVFRVNSEWQIQLNPVVLLAPWNTFGKRILFMISASLAEHTIAHMQKKSPHMYKTHG